MDEVKNLFMLVDVFSDSLGLHIKCAESAFVRFGLLLEEVQCFRALGIPTGILLVCYLGLPVTMS